MLGQVQGGPLSPDSPLHIRPLRMTFVMGGNSCAGSWQSPSIPLIQKIPSDESLSALENAYLPHGWLTHWHRLRNLPSWVQIRPPLLPSYTLSPDLL